MKKVNKSDLDTTDAIKVVSDNYGNAVFHLRNNGLIYRSNQNEDRGFYLVTAEESGPIIKRLEESNKAFAKRAEKKRAKAEARRASCPRCGGTGKLPGYEHIEGGRCFKCG